MTISEEGDRRVRGGREEGGREGGGREGEGSEDGEGGGMDVKLERRVSISSKLL